MKKGNKKMQKKPLLYNMVMTFSAPFQDLGEIEMGGETNGRLS